MATLKEISGFLHEKLNISQFQDSSVNGIQIEGKEEVKKVCVAVDSGLSVIKSAALKKADLLFVHHGQFWGGGPPIVGVHKEIVETLLKNQMTLYACHIPLDAHQELGNNFLLAKHLGLTALESALEYCGKKIGCKGQNSAKTTVEELKAKLLTLPGGDAPITTCLFGPKVPNKIAICTGAAADELYKFEAEGFDTFVTGEPRQFAYHFCKERNLNAIFAGHYRSENLGVKAVGELLKQKFGVEYEFIDEPTGI
jgi:dinuclear metal center YbgI/SA1388 family protein